MGSLRNFLGGSKVVQGDYQVHSNVGAVGLQKFTTGHDAKEALWEKPITTQILATGKVGYTVPNIVNFSGTPQSQIVISTPEIKQSAHIKIGGEC